MPATEQQPEEAATRPAAAAASFAGSLAQTKVYGRGIQQRAGAAGKPQPNRPQTDTSTPARGDARQQPAVDQATAEAEVPWAERAVDGLTRSLDDPETEAEIRVGAPGSGRPDEAAQLEGPPVSAEAFLACSERDAAAAAARLAQGQLLEPPPMAPPPPGMAPGL